jgi:hypothetical protein
MAVHLKNMKKSITILHMENIKNDKTLTSLKVWKQSQQRLKVLAAMEGKSMLQALDDLLIERLLSYSLQTEKTKEDRN